MGIFGFNPLVKKAKTKKAQAVVDKKVLKEKLKAKKKAGCEFC